MFPALPAPATAGVAYETAPIERVGTHEATCAVCGGHLVGDGGTRWGHTSVWWDHNPVPDRIAPLHHLDTATTA